MCESPATLVRVGPSPGAGKRPPGHTRSRGLKASWVKKESSSRSSNITRGRQGQPPAGASQKAKCAQSWRGWGLAGAGEGERAEERRAGPHAGAGWTGPRFGGQVKPWGPPWRYCSLCWALRNSGVLWKASDFFDCKHADI